MFTGIIEEIGTLSNIQRFRDSLQLEICAKRILEDVHVGDSIAVNGVCLTVTEYSQDKFTADVMPETFMHTSLKTLRKGDYLNLERAMAANGRFGGHFVSGHVDEVGVITNRTEKTNALYLEISISKQLQDYVINKGSITIDGTSLTLFKVENSSITISLIPHTQGATILKEKKVGDLVNIECDLLAKYIIAHIQRNNIQSEDRMVSLLERNGFL